MKRRPGPLGARPTASAARGTLDVSVAETPEPRKQHEGRCPWDCLDVCHEGVYRRDLTPIGTHCLVCDRFVSTDEWSRTPTPAKRRS
jgi:hypothetical protein